jgi:hypothetical protein
LSSSSTSLGFIYSLDDDHFSLDDEHVVEHTTPLSLYVPSYDHAPLAKTLLKWV